MFPDQAALTVYVSDTQGAVWGTQVYEYVPSAADAILARSLHVAPPSLLIWIVTCADTAGLIAPDTVKPLPLIIDIVDIDVVESWQLMVVDVEGLSVTAERPV